MIAEGEGCCEWTFHSRKESGKLLHMDAQITIGPEICHGKPVIGGTRTLVSVVLGHIAAGDSISTIGREYDLTEQEIRSVVAFANDQLADQTFPPTPYTV